MREQIQNAVVGSLVSQACYSDVVWWSGYPLACDLGTHPEETTKIQIRMLAPDLR